MSNTDLVKRVIAAFSSGDWATLRTLLTDDFTLTGATPQPHDKNTFISLGQALISAFPNWEFNASDFREEDDRVYLVYHVTGTHSGTLAVAPGVPPVPATGKRVSLPGEPAIYTVRGGQVSQISITFPPGSGVPGLYEQVGAPLG